nr:FmdB family zinc ribbon protein [Methylicorpusculum oleiharenae]
MIVPVYDYKCSDHGVFHDLATMDQAGMPCACPRCGKPSARVILIAPQVLAMAPAKRKIIETNEKAKHEPRLSTPDAREETALRHQHGKSCGCNIKHPDRSDLSQQVVFMPDGSKVFPSQRPWMISH